MKNALHSWRAIKRQLHNVSIFLFLDFDGTLTPLAQTPDRVRFSLQTRSLLEEIARLPFCKVAIISGRPLENIKHLVGVKRITYVGSHGLEIGDARFKKLRLIKPATIAVIQRVANCLIKKLAFISGVLIENKTMSLSVHYRLVGRRDIAAMKKIFFRTVNPYLLRGDIRITRGKKTLEVMPPIQHNKGTAVVWLLEKTRFGKHAVPLYMGDDTTDEDAFKILKHKGITIVVGPQRNSSADYFLANVSEVVRFLEKIAKLQEKYNGTN